MFFRGFKLQPEKNTTRKKKGTVVWPTVEIHVFWRGSNYNREKLRPEKKKYSRLADG
jgi:hypothetical protein